MNDDHRMTEPPEFDQDDEAKLAALREAVQIGLEQLDRGERVPMDDEFFERIKREGRERLRREGRP